MQERRWRRFPLQIPVQVRCKDAGEEVIVGTTRDVSSGGVYFFAEREIGKGSHLELTLSALNCRGRVVRVEEQPSSGRLGIAVEFEQVDIIHPYSLEQPAGCGHPGVGTA